MSLTYKQARDEIFARFKSVWDSTTYPVHYEDVRKKRSTDESPWVVVSLKHSSGFQSTLTGEAGKRTFTRVGYLTAQIFVPGGNGLQMIYDLAKVISDGFEGHSTPGGVWFRNVTPDEVGRDGEFYQLNVVADFRYDEIK